jgi:uncharacterized repeat protein (TIGR03847 family)
MSLSFDLEAPDRFTTGTVGPSGQRTFFLQGREGDTVVTLKAEKEQIRALAEYLAGLLAKLPTAAEQEPLDPALIEPTEAAWAIGTIGVGYDEARDRILVETQELLEEGSEAEPAAVRFRITRGQAMAFVEQARSLIKASRPLCPVCSMPKDPGGHVCPRSNGHVAR